MRHSWQQFLQTFITHYFQIENVVRLFLEDRTFSMQEQEEILSERGDDNRIRKFYTVLIRKDEYKLDVFVSHLRTVSNTELADELEIAISQEKQRLAQLSRDRAATTTSQSSNNSNPVAVPPTPGVPDTGGGGGIQPQPSKFVFPPPNSPGPFSITDPGPLPFQESGSEPEIPQVTVTEPETPAREIGNILSNFGNFEQKARSRTSQIERLNVLPLGSSPSSPFFEIGDENLTLTPNLAARRGSNVVFPTSNGNVPSGGFIGSRDNTLTSSRGHASASQLNGIPPEHVALLNHFLPKPRRPSHSEPTLGKAGKGKSPWQKWTPIGLRTALFKAIENSRYCDPSTIRDALIDRIEQWLLTSEKPDVSNVNSPAVTPKSSSSFVSAAEENINCNNAPMLTLLFIGPAGTGKHDVIKRIASDVLRCDLYDSFSTLVEALSSSSAPDLLVLCSEGFVNNPTTLRSKGSSSTPVVAEKCSKYCHSFRLMHAKLMRYFNNNSSTSTGSNASHQRHPKNRRRLLHVIIQDTNGLFELADVKRIKKLYKEAHSDAGLVMTINEANFRALDPHPKKIFEDDFLNYFSENGVFVFAPMTKQDELMVVARDLNVASATVEQQSNELGLYRLVNSFVDLILVDAAANSASDNMSPPLTSSDKRAKYVRQLIAMLVSPNNVISAQVLGGRLRVQLFKDYRYSANQTGSTRSLVDNRAPPAVKRKTGLAGLFCAGKAAAGASSKEDAENRPTTSDSQVDDDTALLEELRAMIKQKGPFSRKCLQTIQDVLSQQLSDNVERMHSCHFLVKLQLDKKHRDIRFVLANEAAGRQMMTHLMQQRQTFDSMDPYETSHLQDMGSLSNAAVFQATLTSSPYSNDQRLADGGSGTLGRAPSVGNSAFIRLLNCAADNGSART